MKCDGCGSSDVVYSYTEMVNGVTKQYHYCQACYEKMKDKLPSFDYPFSSFFNAKPKNIFTTNDIKAKPSYPSCPSCHLSFDDLQKHGRFGCADCYKHYREILPYYLKNMQYGDKHIGKVYAPEHLDDMTLRKRQLNEQLKDAINEERYEDAVRYRDELKRLEGGDLDEN